MRWFYNAIILLCIVKSNDGSCEITPNDVETVKVKIFYNFHDGKWDATSKLIKSVCDNHTKFGDKMKVEFYLISRVNDNDGVVRCDSSENCDDELVEMCAWKLCDPLAFFCCVDEFEVCMDKNKISREDLKDCFYTGFHTEEGKRLLSSRKELEKAGIDEGPLPALVFNDEKYHKCTDNSAFDNFVWTVCQMFHPDKAPKPPC